MRLKLSAMMLLSIAFLVFTAEIAPAAITGVNVGGTSVAPGNLAGEESGPGWSWIGWAAPRLLVLDSGYTHEIIDISCAATDTVNIVFSGNVAITATGATNAIYSQGIINISGVGGTLTVTSTNAPAIYTGGDLTFSGGKITASAIAGVAIFSGGNMTLTGDAYVTIKRPSGNMTEYSLYIPPGSILTIDSGATLVNLEGTIYNPGAINNNGTINTVTDIEIVGSGAYSGTGVLSFIPLIRDIQGVTPPANKGTPATIITTTPEYTGAITWSPTVSGLFASKTQYTATITLTAIPPVDFSGVPENYFTVAGATTTNPANSGIITAVFPTTSGGGGGGGGCNVSGGGYDVSVLFCILALAALGMFRWARCRK